MRIKIIYTLIAAAFLFLIAGLFWTEIINYEKYQSLSWRNRVRLIPVEAPRGRIFDRNGVPIVSNRLSFDVVTIPQELEEPRKTFTYLGEILDIETDRLLEAMKRNYTVPFVPIRIAEDIPKEKAIILEEESMRLKGVFVTTRPKRDYRFNHVGSHIVGYLGKVAREEWRVLKVYGYQMIDLVGKAGIEKNYNAYLKGSNGGRQLEVDNRGRFIRSLGTKEAVAGKDLHLTIDIKLQEFIDNLFSRKKGAIIVMNPNTGEILSLVSKPNFNPDVFINTKEGARRKQLLDDRTYPLLNRAVSCAYPPGSVFKPVVAASGLDTKKIKPSGTFSCSGKYLLGHRAFRCWDEDGHGKQDVTDGLKNSCNVFFYQLGSRLGVDNITDYAVKFGYGRPTGIDLPGEVSGLVPSSLWNRLIRKQKWFKGDTLNLSIGQGYLLVTPLQVLTMMCVFANGGKLVQPYIVKRISEVEIAGTKFKDLGLSKRDIAIVKRGLKKVVMSPSGTGRRARIKGLEIAGKTGTAQNPRGPSHAWFAGFAPVEDPKIALVVFIEHGGKGGAEACAFAGKVFEKIRQMELI